MRKEWTSLKITQQTLTRLHEEVQFLLRCHVQGRIILPDGAEGFSMDALLNRLLNAVHAHRQRAARQAQRRKAQPKAQARAARGF